MNLFLAMLPLSELAVSNIPSPKSVEINHKPIVVGYLPSNQMSFIPDWTKITHLCIAYGLVGADGSLDIDEIRNNKALIEEAHKNNVKVLLSITGDGDKKKISPIVRNPDTRNILIANLVEAIEDLNLDGIDIDYEEWNGKTCNSCRFYSTPPLKCDAMMDTYKGLRSKINKNKLIIASVNIDWEDGRGGLYNCFNTNIHKHLDFINLMIYDKSKPWYGTSTLNNNYWRFFENTINYWIDALEIPKEKLIIGVPFYGYTSKTESGHDGKQSTKTAYKDIITKHSNAHLVDNIGTLYYNGIPTIRKKTEYIKTNHLGGVMVWKLTLDTDDKEKSLLNIITNTLK